MKLCGKFLRLVCVISMHVLIVPNLTGSTKSIVINFTENDFKISDAGNNKKMVSSSKFFISYPHCAKEDDLPVVPISVLMPHGSKFRTIKTIKTQTTTIGKYKLTYNNHCKFENNLENDMPTVELSELQEPHNFENTVNYFSQYSMCGYTVFQFMIRPFDFFNDELIRNNAIEFDIDFLIENEPLLINLKRIDEIKSSVINGNELEEMYEINDSTLESDINKEELDYAIITSKSLGPYFEPLLKWKNMKGVKSRMYYIEDIYADYSNSNYTNQYKLKRFIYKLDTRYVLLGGDASVIPVQTARAYLPVYNSDSKYQSDIPTDLYYACLDSRNWDSNKNNIIGESDDGLSYSYDRYLTRIPVSTPEDANNFVQKVINYERFADEKEWNNDIVMCSSVPDEMCSFIDERYDYIYQNKIKPFFDGKYFKLCNHYSDFHGGNYMFNKNDLSEILSQGHHFFNIVSESDSLGWNLTSGKFGLQDIYNIKNIGSTILTSAVDFDNRFSSLGQSYFSKNALNSPTANVIAYYGSSDFVFIKHYNKLSKQSTLYDYIGNFYNSLLSVSDSGNHLGNILADSKRRLRDGAFIDNLQRWYYLSMNLMGDPEMPVFLKKPMEFSQFKIKILNSESSDNAKIQINTGCTESKICISYADVSGEFIYQTYTTENETSKTVSIPDNKDVTICITKSNYIPKVIEFNSKCLYIQNETFSEGRVFMSPIIKIGDKVCESKTAGDVVIKGTSRGKYKFLSNEIEMESGVTIEVGADVEMDYISF